MLLAYPQFRQLSLVNLLKQLQNEEGSLSIHLQWLQYTAFLFHILILQPVQLAFLPPPCSHSLATATFNAAATANAAAAPTILLQVVQPKATQSQQTLSLLQQDSYNRYFCHSIWQASHRQHSPWCLQTYLASLTRHLNKEFATYKAATRRFSKIYLMLPFWISDIWSTLQEL